MGDDGEEAPEVPRVAPQGYLITDPQQLIVWEKWYAATVDANGGDWEAYVAKDAVDKPADVDAWADALYGEITAPPEEVDDEEVVPQTPRQKVLAGWTVNQLKKIAACGTYNGGRTSTGQRDTSSTQRPAVAVLPNGDGFIGHYSGGSRHGLGLYIYRKGGSYLGEFANGNKAGVGALVSDTVNYAGEWAKDERSGLGVSLVKKDGCKYAGSWQKNKRNGPGVLTLKDGTRLAGRWVNGKIAEGSWILTDGKVFRGGFKEGRPISGGLFVFPGGATLPGEYILDSTGEEGGDEPPAEEEEGGEAPPPPNPSWIADMRYKSGAVDEGGDEEAPGANYAGIGRARTGELRSAGALAEAASAAEVATTEALKAAEDAVEAEKKAVAAAMQAEDAAYNDRDVKAAAEVLRSAPMPELEISANSDLAMYFLARLLQNADGTTENAKQLEAVSLRGSTITATGAQLIAPALGQVQRLTVSGVKIGDSGAAAIARTLADKSSVVQEVYADNIGITELGLRVLLWGAAASTTVKKLSARAEIKITPELKEAIAAAREKRSTLQIILNE
eukprot:TRINITY_DN298_c0_g1_i1.p1 TRINITY_DN298_c0_g1~~TRINITY_DN298_c0_g1_i1.p1  ORF type:complete len:573 (+),score=176.81 TRINITY_DN298_c0_g1_i1:41-1720(+)